MPIYEYRCENGHNFEVMQSMSDDSITACTTCAAPVQRVFHPVAVHFKGSGFYNTDYGKKKKAGGASDTPPSGQESKTNSSESKSSDKKSSDSTASSSSGSSSTSSSD
jgi:putative FmdB family regulatory protein